MALLHNQPMLFISISTPHSTGKYYSSICSSMLLNTISHHKCSSIYGNMLIIHAKSVLLVMHGQYAHVRIIVHLIIHNYWTSNYALLSLNIRHASSCIIITGMHHHHRVSILTIKYTSSSSQSASCMHHQHQVYIIVHMRASSHYGMHIHDIV